MSDLKIKIGEKIWDKEAIHALLDRNPQAVARALLVIYANQTEDERRARDTKHLNGVGFTSNDAEWLSDIAVKWKRWGRWASERQLAAVRKSVKKYHRQILEHMLETNPDAVRITAREARALPVKPRPEPLSTTPAAWGSF